MFSPCGRDTYLPVFESNQPERSYDYNQHRTDQSGAFLQSMQAPGEHPQYVAPHYCDFDLNGNSNQCDSAFKPPQAREQTPPPKTSKTERDLRAQLRKKQETEQPASQEYEPTTSIPDIEAEILKRGLVKENVRERIAKMAGLTPDQVEAMRLHPYTLEPDPSTW